MDFIGDVNECPICHGKLITRKDDDPKIVEERLLVYHDQTEPLIEYYKKQDKLLTVDGEQKIKKVFADIVKVAKETERKLLKDVYLFDVYEGANLLVGKKSYAVSFILQDENKTLTDVQIDAIMNKLIKNFDEKLDAKIR